MCKIIAIINRNKENTPTLNRILQGNADQLQQEQDGYSIYSNRRKAEPRFYFGRAADNNFLENIKYHGETFFILHTRTATAGGQGVDGLHLQPVNGYLFAHNGFVGKYNQVKNLNDSHYFIADLLKTCPELTKKQIQRAMKNDGFRGKGYLYDTKTGIFRLFTNEAIQLYVLPDCLIFATFPLNLNDSHKVAHEVLGIKWVEKMKGEPIGVLHHRIIDDSLLQFNKAGKLEHWHTIKTRGNPTAVISSAPPYNANPLWGNGRVPDYLKDNEEKRAEQAGDYIDKDGILRRGSSFWDFSL